MILPIYAYGCPVLRKKAQEIDKDYPELNELINNMFETMYSSDGVGLAAPQIGKSIQLFVLDTTPLADDHQDETLREFKKVFINPEIVAESGKEWAYNEGCLSVAGINEAVMRKSDIHIKYYDENFQFHDEKFDSIKARVIQHEYDHLQGILFVDKISPLRKRLLRGKLTAIAKGKITTRYKMVFPAKSKRRG